MENLPENQNNFNEQEIESTIFSNPAEHRQKAPKKTGKIRFRIILSSILAVALLVAGTFAVIEFIPEMEEDTDSIIEQITVLNLETDDFELVEVENKNGQFVLEPIKSGTDDDAVNEWYLKGYDKDLISTSAVEGVVNNVASILAIREISTKTLNECGLENPQIKVAVTKKDKSKFTVSVGDKSPDNSGVYVKVSTDDKIYLVGDNFDEILGFTELDMANTDAIPALKLSDKYDDYYQEEKLSTFDFLTVFGDNFENDIVFQPNQDEQLSEYMAYFVVAPSKRTAQNVETVFSCFTDGITVNGAYSLDVKPATIKSLGLNNPDFAVTAEFDGYKYTYKFKAQPDGDYAVIGDDSKLVKKVAASDCEFLSSKETDFYSTFVYIYSIDKVANLKLTANKKTYSFDIQPNEDEDSEQSYIVNYNGKILDSLSFQNFYQSLISLSCSDFTVDKLSVDDEFTVTYTYHDEKVKPTDITFKKASATKYQYYIDGVAGGKVNSSEMKKIINNLENVVSGKTVTVS